MTGQMFTINLAVDETAIEQRIQDDLYKELAGKVFNIVVGNGYNRDYNARTITQYAIESYMEHHPEFIEEIIEKTSKIVAEKITRSKVKRGEIENRVMTDE